MLVRKTEDTHAHLTLSHRYSSDLVRVNLVQRFEKKQEQIIATMVSGLSRRWSALPRNLGIDYIAYYTKSRRFWGSDIGEGKKRKKNARSMVFLLDTRTFVG